LVKLVTSISKRSLPIAIYLLHIITLNQKEFKLPPKFGPDNRQRNSNTRTQIIQHRLFLKFRTSKIKQIVTALKELLTGAQFRPALHLVSGLHLSAAKNGARKHT